MKTQATTPLVKKGERRPTPHLFIGYRTRALPDAKEFMPNFSANKVLKDEAKIKADLADKEAAYLSNCKNAPYVGTFDEIFLSDPYKNKTAQWVYRPPDSGKPPISVSVWNYLHKYYPEGWRDEEYNSKQPPLRFCGFNPRLFLKMLGEELSLPWIAKPLPLRVWYSNAEHRDIEEAVLSHDFEKILTLETVVKRRRPVPPYGNEEDLKRYDEMAKDWKGPGVAPEKDVYFTVEWATQLGFFLDWEGSPKKKVEE